MNLGNIIRNKIKNRKESIKQNLINTKECSRCGIYVEVEELKNNSRFAMYNNKEICDRCADIIENKMSWKL